MGGVLILALVEISLAIYFKNDLKHDFLKLAEFDTVEREYLEGIMISSGLAYDLSIPARGMVFVRVGSWEKRLKDLEGLMHHFLQSSNAAPYNLKKIDLFFNQMNALLKGGANDAQLGRVARRVKQEVNILNTYLQKSVNEIKSKRAKSVSYYGKKSDFYAWILLVIGLFGLGVILISGGIFITGLLRAVRQLQMRAKEIAGGNYGSLIKTDRQDEIGLLVESVNSMAASLENRERKIEEFNRRLTEQEKMFTIGSFAAGLAHEVGNPIQALMALNFKALDSLQGSDEHKVEETVETLSMIAEQIERLSNIVSEVREYAHPASLEKSLTSINDVIVNTMHFMRFDQRLKHITMRLDLDKDIPAVPIVGDHIAQVLINLFINAADAVDQETGEIVVSSEYEAGDVLIVISDNGHGMSSEAMSHAFEPFFTTKSKGKGTGLGLAVCKDIIEEHGGHMKISSVIGHGTSLTIWLPVDEHHVLEVAQ